MAYWKYVHELWIKIHKKVKIINHPASGSLKWQIRYHLLFRFRDYESFCSNAQIDPYDIWIRSVLFEAKPPNHSLRNPAKLERSNSSRFEQSNNADIEGFKVTILSTDQLDQTFKYVLLTESYHFDLGSFKCQVICIYRWYFKTYS